MRKAILLVAMVLCFKQAWTQAPNRAARPDSLHWISVETDSGVVHAAVAIPAGKAPFPAVIILHGTHGFAQEYVRLATSLAKKGFVGIAACWFAGRKGAGRQFITPIEFGDAPPLVDVAGTERFRIARHSIDMLLQQVGTLPYVRKNRMALLGHSRGAGAALDYVLTHPGKVQALVLNSCGYPPEVTGRAAEVSAPVLVMHGTADNPADGGSAFTDITMARAFEAALRKAKKDVETTYFENSGHNALFSSAAQFEETVDRAAAFLKNKLVK